MDNLPLPAGMVVEHAMLPGIPLTIISGPHEGVTGDTYRVLLPSGKVERVKRGNLII
jgi:hypothetical protein